MCKKKKDNCHHLRKNIYNVPHENLWNAAKAELTEKSDNVNWIHY